MFRTIKTHRWAALAILSLAVLAGAAALFHSEEASGTMWVGCYDECNTQLDSCLLACSGDPNPASCRRDCRTAYRNCITNCDDCTSLPPDVSGCGSDSSFP